MDVPPGTRIQNGLVAVIMVLDSQETLNVGHDATMLLKSHDAGI